MTTEPRTRTRRNGEGSVGFHKPSGRWRYRYWTLQHTRAGGYAATEREAWVQLDAAIKERDQGVPHIAARDTLAAWLPVWLAGRTGLRPRSHERYQQLIAHWVADPIGARRLGAIQPAHVEGALARMQRAGLGASSRSQALTVLGSALRQAMRQHLVGRNVVDLVDRPKVERRPIDIPRGDDLAAIHAGVKGHDLAALYLLAMQCGLREGECLGLDWRHVDFAGGRIRVEQSAIKDTRRVGPPKTRSSVRTIRVHAGVMTALAEHRQRLVDRGTVPHPSRPVFANDDGQRLLAQWVRDEWHRLCDRVGVKRYRFHDLRHLAATELLTRNSASVVAPYLGHSAPSITTDVYGHLDPETIDLSTPTVYPHAGVQGATASPGGGTR